MVDFPQSSVPIQAAHSMALEQYDFAKIQRVQSGLSEAGHLTYHAPPWRIDKGRGSRSSFRDNHDIVVSVHHGRHINIDPCGIISSRAQVMGKVAHPTSCRGKTKARSRQGRTCMLAACPVFGTDLASNTIEAARVISYGSFFVRSSLVGRAAVMRSDGVMKLADVQSRRLRRPSLLVPGILMPLA